MGQWQRWVGLLGVWLILVGCNKDAAQEGQGTASPQAAQGQQCQESADCSGARTCVRLRCLTPAERVIDAYTHVLTFFDTHRESSCKAIADDPKLSLLAAEVSKANVAFIDHYRPFLKKGDRPAAFKRGVAFVNDALQTLQARLSKVTSGCDDASSEKLKVPVSQLMMNDLRAP